MNVCEIFYSLQGESTYAGLPCIFIRLAGCNLRCTYCDTPDSWDKGKEYTIEQIVSEIRQYPCNLVEITGGEPLLQPESIQLMERLDKEAYQILLETNGSQSIQTVPVQVHNIIDVKLPGSGQQDCFLTSNLSLLKPDRDEIKFVLSDRADFIEALRFIKNFKLENYILLFSPVSGKLAPHTLAGWIMETGLPLRLNLQLHKLLNLK